MHLKPHETVTITVHPRLHLTLIGMNENGHRVNGGVGFSVASPTANITVRRASHLSVIDRRPSPLEPIEIEKLMGTVRGMGLGSFEVTIEGHLPSHCGFGSATALRLATIEGVSEIADTKIDRLEAVRLSGRGGTSGIGITTYFDGGIVCDIGVRHSANVLAPSSAIEGTRPTPYILHAKPMPSWPIGICIPGNIASLSLLEETEFFQNSCPIPTSEVYSTLYEVIYGLIASAAENDIHTFCNSIRQIQTCRWKALERDLYGPTLLSLEESIYKAGALAVGMSSLGPGLFFLAENLPSTVANLRERLPSHTWIATACHNLGRSKVHT
ncbi:MAG TPA: beta-ribofuranosylaminobenzene 5'-phosphate synthase family protein [Verrucomicrobiae bacterium]